MKTFLHSLLFDEAPLAPNRIAPLDALVIDNMPSMDGAGDAELLPDDSQPGPILPAVPPAGDDRDVMTAVSPNTSDDSSANAARDDATSADITLTPVARSELDASQDVSSDASTTTAPMDASATAGSSASLSAGPVGASAANQANVSAVVAAPGPSDILPAVDDGIASLLSGAAQAAGTISASVNSVLGPPATAVTGGGISPFVINVTYDASVSGAPAGFRAVIDSVVQFLESQFSDPVTMNITIGYGEVGGNVLSAGALGQSQTFLNSYSYDQLRTALTADSKTADDAVAAATLPLVSPVNGTFWATRAEAKALGLLGPSTSFDGYVGFSSGNLFDYDTSNGVTAGLYDFYGVVAHELTEVMGRSLLVGAKIGSVANSYEPLDLFHFSAAGVRDFVGTQPGYFSIDSGVTNLASFNTNSAGDFGDWASSVGPDSFLAFSNSGVINPVSQTDIRVMDILGWDRGTAILQPDLTASGFSFDGTTVHFQVNNFGTGPAAASNAGVYLSADSVITNADTLIATAATPALLPGGSSSVGGSLPLPSNLATPGTYYLGALADSNGQIAESNEANNGSNTVLVILGNAADNTLTGTQNNDLIFGFAGDDNLTGGAGADTMFGGTGNDSYVVDNAGDLVTENAGEGTDTVFASISYTLTANVEKLALTGSAAINATGNSLNNVVAGNSGNNQLTGGSGVDQFLFNAALNRVSNVDTLTDFSHTAADKIDLDHTIFTALTHVTLGTAIASRDFFASADGSAHRTTDHILYNATTGALSYDPDGTGATAAVQFAVVANHPALVSSDFLLV